MPPTLRRLSDCYSFLKGVVDSNGALQLAFGLFFGVGYGGKGRLACALLVCVQLFGMWGIVDVLISRSSKALDPESGRSLSTSIIVLQYVCVISHRLSSLVNYLFAFFYVRKFAFVASTGMAFPCPPAELSLNGLAEHHRDYFDNHTDDHAEQGARASDNSRIQSGDHVPESMAGKEKSGSGVGFRVHALINLVSFVWLAVTPFLWVLLLCRGRPLGMSTLGKIAMSLQTAMVFPADIAMVLVFVSMTQHVVDQISLAKDLLSDPSSMQRSAREASSSHSTLASDVVSMVKKLERDSSAWVSTMSTWFVIHQLMLFVVVCGEIAYFFVNSPMSIPQWIYYLGYPTMIVSAALPLVCASRVTRHWDKMVNKVLTSEKWLPNHWQEHIYLRQFLEHSSGGFHVVGIRLSGSILVSVVTVAVSLVATFNHIKF